MCESNVESTSTTGKKRVQKMSLKIAATLDLLTQMSWVHRLGASLCSSDFCYSKIAIPKWNANAHPYVNVQAVAIANDE